MPSQKARRYYQLLHRQMERLRAARQTLDEERRAQEDFARMTLNLPAEVAVETDTLAGCSGRWVIPARPRSAATLLYLHGGAYQTGSSATQLNLAAHLARAAGHRLWAPDYRLAPEHPFPAALDDALAAYRALRQDAPLAIAGDSAGGGLALALALRVRDETADSPAALALLSPWTDLTLGNPTHQSHAHLDPFFPTPDGLAEAAQRYAGATALDHPWVSPLHARLDGLPPLRVHVGDQETLLDDSRLLVEEARAAGVDADLEVWPGLWHVWQSYAGRLPEADESLAALGEFLSRRLLSPGGSD